MNKDIKIGIIGGDMRYLAAAAEMARGGREIAVYGFDGYFGGSDSGRAAFAAGQLGDIDGGGGVTRCATIEGAVRASAAVILPLPVTNDGTRLNCPLGGKEIKLAELFCASSPGQLFLGGRVNTPGSSSLPVLAAEAGVRLVDYYSREELSVYNSVPTAEGAIAIAMNELPVTISGCSAQVIGYGRVGRTLAAALRGLGASVTVYARREADIAWAGVRGCIARRTAELAVGGDASSPSAAALPHPLAGAAVVFNTVPAPLLGRAELERVSRDCAAFGVPPPLFIDLASAPGGIDRVAAEELSLRSIWALSLPGRVAPVSAGRMLARCLNNIIGEELARTGEAAKPEKIL